MNAASTLSDAVPPRNLDSLFAPEVVALVGASERSYLARTVWHAMIEGGYTGRMVPVNPGRHEVFGVPCYPSLNALPAAADLCLIAVPESQALAVLQSCEAQGVAAAILFTLFGNTPEGRAYRESVLAFLRQSRMAVSGSGTFGLLNLQRSFMPLLATPPNTQPGHIALVCQSGGILNAVSKCLRVSGVGLTKAIATGGEDQLGAADYIDYLLDDGVTRAIGCVLEQIKDIAAFRRACDRARKLSVSVVVLAVGRSAKGREAALAHSGSLASSARMIDGLLNQVGAIAVRNLTGMVNVLAVLSRLRPRPLGKRAAIVTISGGETGLAADLAEDHRLALADLHSDTLAKLRTILHTPDACYRNPVDTALGSLLVLTDPKVYVESVKATLSDPGVDFVMARHLDQQGVFEGLSECAAQHDKPVFLYTRAVQDVLSTPGERYCAPLLLIADLDLALDALGKVSRHDDERSQRELTDPTWHIHATADGTLAPKRPEAGILLENEVFPLLVDAGIATPPYRVLARGSNVDEAVSGMDGPFVVKILSDHIVHRRSAGGVRVGLQTRAQVGHAVIELFDRFGSDAYGVIVEPMVRFDIEFILGAKRTGEGQLAIMLGLGGTFVEDMQDLALRLSPLSRWDASRLVHGTGVAVAISRLAGQSYDAAIAALTDHVLAFDRLCRRIGAELAEFDVNPLGFSASDNRFCALDGKIVFSTEPAQ